jgi:starch-binding outer membrane protein, SusD/RagB family
MSSSQYKISARLLIKSGIVFFLSTIQFSYSGCKKYLDQKPNKSDVVPSTLNDLQALLDNSAFAINSQGTGGYSELIADNIYVTAATWQSFASSPGAINKSEAQNYIWGDLAHDNYWSVPYSGPIYYSNIVLDQLPLINTLGEDEKHDFIKGSALFYRAFAFNELAQLFCKPFSSDNLNEPGIVLRLTSNISEKTGRATIRQTYDRIIEDLTDAAELLPSTSSFATRPTKRAAYAALARVYLFMRNYTSAAKFANQVLQEYNTLIDFNTLIPLGNPPIKTFNSEVIFQNYM